MSCSAVDDSQRSAHWRTGNWNCPGSINPDQCASNEVPIKINTMPGGGWFGGCGILGNKTQYVCSSPYPTDTTSLWECCSGTTSPYQCDPAYCQNSTQCDSFLQTNCNGQILFSNDGTNQYKACNSWCSKNPTACDALKKSYCNNTTNMALPVCKSFAQAKSNSSDNTFDATVQDFCATHQSDPFCGCQVKTPTYTGSDSSLLKLLNAPQCYDATCINNGYENTNQISFRKNGNCPTSICSNSINVSNVSSSNLSNIIASCDAKTTVVPTTSSAPSQSDVSSQSTTVAHSSSSTVVDKRPLIVSVFLFILFIFMAFLFWPTGSVVKGGAEYKESDYNEFIN